MIYCREQGRRHDALMTTAPKKEAHQVATLQAAWVLELVLELRLRVLVLLLVLALAEALVRVLAPTLAACLVLVLLLLLVVLAALILHMFLEAPTTLVLVLECPPPIPASPCSIAPSATPPSPVSRSGFTVFCSSGRLRSITMT